MYKVRHHKSGIEDINLIDARYRNHASKRHYHLDYHFGFITQGKLQYFQRGGYHYAGAGECFNRIPYEIHDCQSVEKNGFQIKIFSVTSSWLEDQAEAISGKCQIHFPEHRITDSQLFLKLSSLYWHLSNPVSSQLAKDSLPIEYFSFLLTTYGKVNERMIVKMGSKDLRQLREYLMEHLDQKVNLKDLSQLCDLSSSQLLRQFKRTIGITPCAWLACLRLEHAMALLKAGYCSTEVAFHVGFYDQPHFTRTFKLAFGISPSQVK